MTQRNPMNERNTTEGAKAGVTRKSASQAKPKSKAAASVTIDEPSSKNKKPQTKAEKQAYKAKEQAKRKAENSEKAKYYNPPTQRYKMLRRIWFGTIAAAILCTILAWVGRDIFPEWGVYTVLVLAYIFIIACFYIDFILVRRERKRYQEEMTHGSSKALRAEQKKARAEARQAAKEAEARKAAGLPEPEPEKKGLKGVFGRAKSGADNVVEKQAEAGSVLPKK